MQQASGGFSSTQTNHTNVTTTTSAMMYQGPPLTTTTTSLLMGSPISSPTYSISQVCNTPGSTRSRISDFSNLSSPLSTSAHPPTQSEHDNLAWQVVSVRRPAKRAIENDQNNTKLNTKRTNNATPKSTLTSNRFVALSENNGNDEQMEETLSRSLSEPKPPPIIIESVVNYPQMLLSIETVLGKTEFLCKAISNNQVKINTNTIDAYRKLQHFLKQNNIACHTFQPKQEIAYRVVIKGLHHSIPVDDIKEALTEQGFLIRNVVNIRDWKTKNPLPLFFIDQEPNDNNKKIYQITNLLNIKITVEPPRKRNVIPQCLRCQQYGHTRTYCTKKYYCVKCGESHPTSECKKKNDTPATCALCNGPHPASYKGCSVYQDLQKARNKPVYQHKSNDNSQNNKHYYQSQSIRENVSFSQIAKNNITSPSEVNFTQPLNEVNNTPTQSSNDLTLSQFLNKFEAMFTQLMNQNSMIINLITTLVKAK